MSAGELIVKVCLIADFFLLSDSVLADDLSLSVDKRRRS